MPVTLATVLLCVVGACGGADNKGTTPTGARASCGSDSDCAVTDLSPGCCQSCRDAPHAIPTLAFEQQKNRCSVVDCAPSSDRIECPKVEPIDGFVAKCKEGTCAATKR